MAVMVMAGIGAGCSSHSIGEQDTARQDACTAPVLTGRLDGPLKWRSEYNISTSFTSLGVGDRYWNHSIHLQNTGAEPIVLERVYATGMDDAPTPVVRSATIAAFELPELQALRQTLRGTLPDVAGYQLQPTSRSNAPYLVLGLVMPKCTTAGDAPFEYAYGQNYVVTYHILGSSTRYLAPFAFRDVLCGPGAPGYCSKREPEDWPS